MKVCIVCTSLAGGGAERFTANLANMLTKRQVDVYVLTGPKTENDYELVEDVTRICDLKCGKRLIHDILTIRRISYEQKIDIVIGIDLTINICAALANILFSPKVIISERSAPMSAEISAISRFLRMISYPLADGYVFQTNGAKEFYSQAIQKKAVVIYNPIKDDIPYRNVKVKKEIVAIGRLRHEKNYELLLKSFSIILRTHNDYILRIFGDGNDYEKLQQLVKRLDIEENVIFEGFSKELHNKIINSDIYVLSSLYEGMPNSLMEAMAMGVPVIATDCPAGGPAELIKNKYNGLLVKNNDLDEMTNAINFYLSNPEEKEKMGLNATRIREVASSEVIAEKWMQYMSTIKEK